jgi:hypothetical protein
MTGIVPCKDPRRELRILCRDVPTMLHCGLTYACSSTFLKRKAGLMKKAHELSVLCSVDVAVIIFGTNKKLYEYSSGDMRELIARYTYVRLRNSICSRQHRLLVKTLRKHSTDRSGFCSTEVRLSTRAPQTSTAAQTMKKTRMAMVPPHKPLRAPLSLR